MDAVGPAEARFTFTFTHSHCKLNRTHIFCTHFLPSERNKRRAVSHLSPSLTSGRLSLSPSLTSGRLSPLAVGPPTQVVAKLQKLEAEFGPHFAPPQLLLDKAAKGETFHM